MRKRIGIVEADVDRWIGQGLGQGQGDDYKSWFHIRDVPSSGKSHRIHSLRFDRVHHLLSDLEFFHFLQAERTQAVTEIREQYALLPRAETCEIAKQLGIRHPQYPYSSTPTVMTTDLLVTVADAFGKLTHIANHC